MLRYEHSYDPKTLERIPAAVVRGIGFRHRGRQAGFWIGTRALEFANDILPGVDDVVTFFNQREAAPDSTDTPNMAKLHELLGDQKLPTFAELMKQPGACNEFNVALAAMDLMMENGENKAYDGDYFLRFHLTPGLHEDALVGGATLHAYGIMAAQALSPDQSPFDNHELSDLICEATTEMVALDGPKPGGEIWDRNPLFDMVASPNQLNWTSTMAVGSVIARNGWTTIV